MFDRGGEAQIGVGAVWQGHPQVAVCADILAQGPQLGFVDEGIISFSISARKLKLKF